MVLIVVKQEGKSKDSSVVVHELEFAIKRDLHSLLRRLGSQYNVPIFLINKHTKFSNLRTFL